MDKALKFLRESLYNFMIFFAVFVIWDLLAKNPLIWEDIIPKCLIMGVLYTIIFPLIKKGVKG